jgi:hypothetical protein
MAREGGKEQRGCATSLAPTPTPALALVRAGSGLLLGGYACLFGVCARLGRPIPSPVQPKKAQTGASRAFSLAYKSIHVTYENILDSRCLHSTLSPALPFLE